MISSRLRNPIWLGIVALTFIWPFECGVEAVRFVEWGDSWSQSVYHGDQWTITNTSIFLKPSGLAGRFLHPHPVQMKDPLTDTAKPFSCEFNFQILIQDGNASRTGSGLTFIMVPDKSTVGAPEGYMGLLSTNTSENAHTFGVEFDTHMNPEFNDPNDNHIGIDLASMNSTATFIPQSRLAQIDSPDAIAFYFVTINYNQTVDISFETFGVLGSSLETFSTSVDMSLLNEYMYIGFSASVEKDGNTLHTLFAWSFSNDGPAENIRPLDATPTSGERGGGRGVGRWIAIVFCIIGAICIGIAMLYLIRTQSSCSNTNQPIRIYLAHARGEKNFTEQLHKDLKSTWSYKLNRIELFFDRHSLPWGECFAKNILRELTRTQVGIVVVSREFFERPWPMTELVYLVRSKSSNESGLRIVPLFYRLSVDEVRRMVRAGTWDAVWSEMASPRHRHPLNADECRAAVNILCNQRGVLYVDPEQNTDVQYRQDVLKVVAEICNDIEQIEMQEQRSRRNFED